MGIKLLSALILGKSISFLTKVFKIGGGSAAPGYYALKIDPDLVSKLASKIPINIIVTGTNGKTTTARMIAHFAKEAGLKVIRNHTGSNLERGIASALINGVNLSHPWGGLNRHLGIWELDEAVFNSMGLKLKPNIIVFLNVFRDQLDRYGEVDSIVKKWAETISKLNKNTKIFINGDDQNLLELQKSFKGKTLTFGVQGHKITGEKKLLSPSKKLDFEAKNIRPKGLLGTDFELKTTTENWEVFLSIPGIYHIYDFLAAFSVAECLEIKPSIIINSFKNFAPAFGRVEKFNLPNSKEGFVFLIKNPTGANQIFETIKDELKEKDCLLIALNDNFADGTDVSWIWDCDFEKLSAISRQLSVVCSGKRAYDLALRLKYAGFDSSHLIQSNLKQAFEKAQEGLEGRLFILPTYTCLLELQKILVKANLKKEYWREE